MEKSRITVRFEPSGEVQGRDATVDGGNGRPKLPRQAGKVIPLRPNKYAALDEPSPAAEQPSDATGHPAERPPAAPVQTPEDRAESRERRRTSSAKDHLDSDYPYDYGAWNRTAAQEADELERLIRHAEQIGELPPEEDDLKAETGYWEEPGERASRRGSLRRTYYRHSGEDASPAWWKMAGSVLGAVATGILFGTLLMDFFTGSEPAAAPPAKEIERPAEGTVQQDHAANPGGGAAAADGASGAGAADSDAAESALASVEIPERRLWLLQYGNFKTLDNARAMAESIREKGFAATIEEADGFYVYAGVAAEREAALRTGVKLQAEGLEVYVKPFALPAVTQVRWEDGSAEALSDYLARGTELVRLIGGLTLVHFEGEPVAPEPTTLEKLRAEHLGLQELQPSAFAGLPADAQPLFERMDIAARNAVTAIEEYGAHPDHAYLWSAQSALMDYLIAEKQLLTTIAMK